MIISVIGARPQFVKAAVVSRAFRNAGIDEQVVHTGQHYDDSMSGTFIRDLGIDNIVAQFSCGAGTHAVQTAKMMMEFESYILNQSKSPKLVVVYGDTNSTIAASLVASKLHIPIAHVEAGLRSFNREMPEEINRIVTDHLSEMHFCSSEEGVQQLHKEGIHKKVNNVGDVMLDAFLHFSELARTRTVPNSLTSLRISEFGLVTIHRPSNTDDDCVMSAILAQLSTVNLPFMWPVHPRLRERIRRLEIPENIHLVEPFPYLDMLKILDLCQIVLTDSGGLQKEAHWAKKQCITFRKQTEWIETLFGGWNTLFDPQKQSLIDIISSQPSTPWECIYGDGKASERIATSICDWLQK